MRIIFILLMGFIAYKYKDILQWLEDEKSFSEQQISMVNKASIVLLIGLFVYLVNVNVQFAGATMATVLLCRTRGAKK